MKLEPSVRRETILAQIAMRRAGRRQRVMHGGTLCSRCLTDPPQNEKTCYCAPCKAQIARDARTAMKARMGAV